jgi:hypothetical protein
MPQDVGRIERSDRYTIATVCFDLGKMLKTPGFGAVRAFSALPSALKSSIAEPNRNRSQLRQRLASKIDPVGMALLQGTPFMRAQMISGALAAGAILFSTIAFLGSANAADGPFANMGGTWTGSGTITVNNNKERLRCRANYTTKNSGSTVELDIVCAGDSYKFNLTGGVNYVNGSISGNWSESAHGAAGTISGRASAGSIQANATGPYFSALLNMRTSGNSQSVSLISPGSQISSVTMNLARRK